MLDFQDFYEDLPRYIMRHLSIELKVIGDELSAISQALDIAKALRENVFFENVENYKNWKYNIYYLSKIEFAKTDFKTNQFIVNYPFDTVESIIGLKPKLTQSALSAIFGQALQSPQHSP